MHELTIANSILQAVVREMELRNLRDVETIVLRIGALSDVVPEALEFNFDIIKADTPLAQTKLVMEQVPLKGQCRACAQAFEVVNYLFACPKCGSGQIEITQGEELDIAYLEVADDGDVA